MKINKKYLYIVIALIVLVSIPVYCSTVNKKVVEKESAGYFKDRDMLEITLTKTIVETGAAVMMKSLAVEEDVRRFRAKIVNPSTDSISQNLQVRRIRNVSMLFKPVM